MAWERKISYAPSSAGYWLSQSIYSDTDIAERTGTLGVSKLSLLWSRTSPAGISEDLAMIDMHLSVHTGGHSWASLAPAAKALAEASVLSWWTTQKVTISSTWLLETMIWHDWEEGNVLYGPADRLTAVSVAGTNSSGRMPDQIANTVTFVTASRRHWGRIYLGGVGMGQYDVLTGRITNSQCNTMAANLETLQNDLVDNSPSVEIVVFSKQYAAVLTIDEMHVDNVPDTIRSRRFKRKSYTAIADGP